MDGRWEEEHTVSGVVEFSQYWRKVDQGVLQTCIYIISLYQLPLAFLAHLF